MCAFNVNDFRSQLQLDGSRPNLFEVYLTFPGGVVNSGGATTKVTFMAKAAQLPGSTVGIVPLYYFGREIKVPGNRTFQDWTISVINDEDFLVRNGFESWLNLINSHVGNVRDPSMVNDLGYSSQATVYQYPKTGGPDTGNAAIAEYDFIGMFPVDVSPIDLDWGSNDTIEEFSVTLAYQYWTKTAPVPVTDTDGSAGIPAVSGAITP